MGDIRRTEVHVAQDLHVNCTGIVAAPDLHFMPDMHLIRKLAFENEDYRIYSKTELAFGSITPVTVLDFHLEQWAMGNGHAFEQ